MEQMEQMEQMFRKIPQNARLKGFSEITVPSVPSVPPPLARRNLTDEQRTLILGRLYNQMKLAPHRPSANNVDKLSTFSGAAATSRYVASLHGVSAPRFALSPPRFRPPTLYIVRYDGNGIDSG
jgi:hypothetical protein